MTAIKSSSKVGPRHAAVNPTPARSRNMAAIRSRGNRSTELAFVALLRLHGITGWRRHLGNLPGTPDFAFPSVRLALFIDGCFWHACPKCYRKPHDNSKFWEQKRDANRRRDRRANRALHAKGWRVLRIWEHSLKREPTRTASRVKRAIQAESPL